jgi:hypothetical protein
VVSPPGSELPREPRPLIYLAPVDSAFDLRVLLASLASAGLPVPRWVPCTHGKVADERLRAAFLAGEPVLVPLSPPRTGPDRLARLLVFAQQAGVRST